MKMTFEGIRLHEKLAHPLNTKMFLKRFFNVAKYLFKVSAKCPHVHLADAVLFFR